MSGTRLANGDGVALSVVPSTVLQIFGAERAAGAELILLGLRSVGAGDGAALQRGVARDVDVESVITCSQAALF